MKTKNYSKGFTLVELLLVIAIIAILASVLFVSLGKQRERARVTTFKENTRGLVTTFTACTDGGGVINAPTEEATYDPMDAADFTCCAEGETPATCTGLSYGRYPNVVGCNGTGNAEIHAGDASGDAWFFNARCDVSAPAVDTTSCYANCNADGCIFCNEDLNYADGAWDSCDSDSNCG